MSSSQLTAPFLYDMRQKWQNGALSSEEVIAEVLTWEDDIYLRTDEEMDAAWAFRQEVEGSGGLKSASDLQYLLDSSLEHHIDDVLDELKEITSLGWLGDSYARVIETILAEGGPRHRRMIGQMLYQITAPEPKLQAILTSIIGWEATILDEEEEDPTASAASTAGSTNHAQSSTSTKTPKSSPDPWLTTLRFIALGRWKEARQALDQLPAHHPRADEMPSVLAAIDEGEVYDQVPALRPMAGMLSASRNRRDWDEFKRRRAEAEKYVSDASAQAGRPIPVPKSLRDIFDEALKAQDAEALVEKAIQQRERGDFPGAATSLADALTLDPRFVRVQFEQQFLTDLQNLLYTLYRTPLTKPEDLVTGMELCDQLLDIHAAPYSLPILHIREKIAEKINSLVAQVQEIIAAREREMIEAGNIEDRLKICSASTDLLSYVEPFSYFFSPDHPLLLAVESDKLTRLRLRLEQLRSRRDMVRSEIEALSLETTADIVKAAAILQDLEILMEEPLARGDEGITTVARQLAAKFSSYLCENLQLDAQISQHMSEEYRLVLNLAQRGPRAMLRPVANMFTQLLSPIPAISADYSPNKRKDSDI